jgi:CHAD domain-containing protein
MQKDIKFTLPEDFQQHAFIRELQDRYLIQQEQTCQEHYVYYDTFDWRLYNKSLVLCSTAHTLLLQSLETFTVLDRAPITVPPVLLADFPSGSLQEKVAPIIEMRALLKLFAMEATCTHLRIVNNDAKTVLRLLVEVDTLADAKDTRPFATYLWLKPIRGYDKEAKKFSRWLTSKGWTISPDHIYLQGLAAVKKQPGAYSSKIHVHLQPTLRSDEAIRVILRELFHIIKCNTEGVKNDIDTEFLHDFRVAVRRARAVLGQIKEVFPAEVTAQLKKDCAYLGAMTNPVRDLDVYLLHQGHYKTLLPPSVRPDIEPLFAHLQRERTKAYHTLRRQLDSPTYADLLRRWEAFLAQSPTGDVEAANTSRPIIEVAGKRLRRLCRNIVQLGTQLLTEPDDERLHELRIVCKKLRYVLECFSSLFPGKKTAILIKCLRHLQDNLGRAHDLFVQQAALRHFATTCSGAEPQRHNTLQALDILMHRLEEDKQTVRQAFPALFAAFAARIGDGSAFYG